MNNRKNFKQTAYILISGIVLIANSEVKADVKADYIAFTDDNQILENTRNQINNWNAQQNYNRLWNVNTGNQAPTDMAQRQYVIQQLTRYTTKRVEAFVKTNKGLSRANSIDVNVNSPAKGGKTGLVQTAVSQKEEKWVDMSFSAKPLQGKAALTLKTVLFDATADVRVNGQRRLNIERNFKNLGMRATVNFNQTSGLFVAKLDQSITNEVTASVIHTQERSGLVDNAVVVSYQKAF